MKRAFQMFAIVFVVALIIVSCSKSSPTQGITNNNNTDTSVNHNNIDSSAPAHDSGLLSQFIVIDTTLSPSIDTQLVVKFTYDNLKRLTDVLYIEYPSASSQNGVDDKERAYFYSGMDTLPYKAIKYKQSTAVLIDTIYYSYSFGNLISDSTISPYNTICLTNRYTYVGNTVIRHQETENTVLRVPYNIFVDTFHLTRSGNTVSQLDTLYRGNPGSSFYENFSYTVDSHPNPLSDKIPIPVSTINYNGWSDVPPEQNNNYINVNQLSSAFDNSSFGGGFFGYAYKYNRFGWPASSLFYYGYSPNNATVYAWKAYYLYGSL